jgi:hypothetical protein
MADPFTQLSTSVGYYATDPRRRDEMYRAAARLRDQTFVEEQLSHYELYLQETAEGYKTKLPEVEEKYNKWKEIWDYRFEQAERMYQSQAEYEKELADWAAAEGRSPTGERIPKPQRRTSGGLDAGWGRVSAYGPMSDKYGNAYIDPSKYFDFRTGKRKTWEEIIAGDTSKRGNKFMAAQEAEQAMITELDFQEVQSNYSKYQQQFDAALQALAERNKKAKEEFLANKAKLLETARGVSGYSGATYIEKPL